MKTALLLPGHMRAYRETFNNQLKTILEPNNCDIYISTSTTKTVVNGNNISSVEYNKKKLEEELNLFYGELLLVLTQNMISMKVLKKPLHGILSTTAQIRLLIQNFYRGAK